MTARGARGSAVTVGPITRVPGTGRVTADVDGEDLWFESADLTLSPAVEAYGSALLIPALHQRRPLRLPAAADPAWRANQDRVVATLARWWRYPRWAPMTPDGASVARPAAPDAAPPERPLGLFFSGGVDSLHCLLRGTRRPDWLITLWGFDFPLDDAARGAAVERSVRAVAAATGCRLAIVRTNARRHPLIAGTPWERVHGGILAAVAHLSAPAIPRMMIASSTPGDQDAPYGSHGSLDPLWSSSRCALLFEQRGMRRIDKLRALAHEPLVRDHLRVCWRNFAPTGNCGRCAKCLLAMLILEGEGALASSAVFEGRSELAARIDALRKAPDREHTFEEAARVPGLDPQLVTAVHALIRRSRRSRRFDVRLRRAIASWVWARFRSAGRRATPA